VTIQTSKGSYRRLTLKDSEICSTSEEQNNYLLLAKKYNPLKDWLRGSALIQTHQSRCVLI